MVSLLSFLFLLVQFSDFVNNFFGKDSDRLNNTSRE